MLHLLFFLLLLLFEIYLLYRWPNFLNRFLNNFHFLVQFFIIIIPLISKWFDNNLQLIYSFFGVFLDLFCSFAVTFFDLLFRSFFGNHKVYTLILLAMGVWFIPSFLGTETPLCEILRYDFVLWSLIFVSIQV
jgi:hypothetical protein